jgi:hypothetical protein
MGGVVEAGADRSVARIERSIHAWPCPDGAVPGVAFAFPGRSDRTGKAALCLEVLWERRGLPDAIAFDGHPRSGPEGLLAEAMACAAAESAGGARTVRVGARPGGVASRFGTALAGGPHPGVSVPTGGRSGAWRSRVDDPVTEVLALRGGAALGRAIAEAGFSKGFLEGLRLLPEGPAHRSDWVALVFRGGEPGRALARDYPLLSWIVTRAPEAVEALVRGASPAAGLFPHAPNPEALMRRFLGVGSTGAGRSLGPESFGRTHAEIASAMRFVSALPPDWIRPDAGEMAALAELARSVPAASARLRTPASVLMAPCAGRFASFLSRCEGDGVGYRRSNLMDLARDAGDVADDLARRILAPLLARSYVETGEGEGGEGALPGRARDLAHAVLHARRGLPSILERSVRWHRMLPRIDALMPRGDIPETRWDPPCPPLRVGGMEVRALASALELADEGADGRDADGLEGLSHCVAGYATRCMAGGVDILSVRRVRRDGTSRSPTTATRRG